MPNQISILFAELYATETKLNRTRSESKKANLRFKMDCLIEQIRALEEIQQHAPHTFD